MEEERRGEERRGKDRRREGGKLKVRGKGGRGEREREGRRYRNSNLY